MNIAEEYVLVSPRSDIVTQDAIFDVMNRKRDDGYVIVDPPILLVGAGMKVDLGVESMATVIDGAAIQPKHFGLVARREKKPENEVEVIGDIGQMSLFDFSAIITSV